MRFTLAILLIALLFAGNAAAAVISSTTTGGDYGDPNTWVGGVVPTTGDTGLIYGPITMEVTRTIDVPLFLFNDSSLTIPAGVTLYISGPTTVNIQLANTSTLNVYGSIRLTSGALPGGSTQNAMIDATTATTTINVQGELLDGYATIADIPVLSGNVSDSTSTGRLYVTLDREPPVDATHVRILHGPYKNAIWPIAWRDNYRVGLAGALLSGNNNTTSLIMDSASSGDSISVIDTDITPDEWSWPGSYVIQDNSTTGKNQNVGMIYKVFNNAAASMTAMFLDGEDQFTATNGSSKYIVTKGVRIGDGLEFLRMATIQGAHQRPSVLETLGGNPATNAGTGKKIFVDGNFDVDYGEFKWLSGYTGGAIHSAAGAPDWELNDVLFYENHGQNHIYYLEPGGNVTIDQMFVARGLGPQNTDFGHVLHLSNQTDAAMGTATLTNCAAMWIKDDFVFGNQGGNMYVSDTWVVGGIINLANFIDIGNTGAGYGTYGVRAERVRVIGLGETPMQMDTTTATLSEFTLKDSTFINNGLALGRTTLETHESDDGNAVSGVSINVAAITANDVRGNRFEWGPWKDVAIGGTFGASDTLFFYDTVIENCGNYQTPGAETWNPSTMYVSGGLQISGSGKTVFDGLRLLNPYRRGWAMGTWNTNTSVGVTLRGASPGFFGEFRNSVFNGDRSYEEGLTHASYYWVIIGNVNWTGGGFKSCQFENIKQAVNLSSTPLRIVPFYGCGFKQRDNENSQMVNLNNDDATGTSGAIFTNCAFIAGDGATAQMTLHGASGNPTRGDYINCTFWDEYGDIPYFLNYFAGAENLTDASDGNTCNTTNIATISGVGVRTLAQMEASYGWANSDDGSDRGDISEGWQ